MSDIERQASLAIENYCNRVSSRCKNISKSSINEDLRYQCKALDTSEVVAVFEGEGCIKAAVPKSSGRRVVHAQGVMTKEGFRAAEVRSTPRE